MRICAICKLKEKRQRTAFLVVCHLHHINEHPSAFKATNLWSAFITSTHNNAWYDRSTNFVELELRACLHGVGDPGLVGLVLFLFSRSGGHKIKETYPTRPGSPTPCKQGINVLRTICIMRDGRGRSEESRGPNRRSRVRIRWVGGGFWGWKEASAERRALAKICEKKRRNSSARSKSTRQPSDEVSSAGPSNTPAVNQQLFPGQSFRQRRPQPSDKCLSCGQRVHWANSTSCPSCLRGTVAVPSSSKVANWRQIQSCITEIRERWV